MSDAPPPPTYDSLFGGGRNGLHNGQNNNINQQQNGDARQPSAPPAFNPGYGNSLQPPILHAPASNSVPYPTYNGQLPQFNNNAASSSSTFRLPYPTSPSPAFPPRPPQPPAQPTRKTSGGSWWPFGGGDKTVIRHEQPQPISNSYRQNEPQSRPRPYQPFGSAPTLSSSSSSLIYNQNHAAAAQLPAASQQYQQRDPFARPQYSSEEETELRGLFSAVDEDGDGHITIPELQSALLNDNWTPFKTATVRMLLRMFDQDVNDTIEYDEFRDMKSFVQQFQRIFDTYDADRSGTIDAHEVRQALTGMGFGVGEQFCNFLCSQFNQSRVSHASAVNLDTFIQICATIKHATAQYEAMHGSDVSASQPAYENFLRGQLQQLR